MHFSSSLPGLTRQSILSQEKMDARIKSAHDELPFCHAV
jgi:hypothetical protein